MVIGDVLIIIITLPFTCFAGSLRCRASPTPSILPCQADPTSLRPTTPLMNLRTSPFRPGFARRSLNCASVSWRTGIVPTRNVANLPTVHKSCVGTTNRTSSIRQRNVVASKTISFVYTEIAVTSSTLPLLPNWSGITLKKKRVSPMCRWA